ncbi:MAG: hypothetical protein JNG88_16460 [Phycisphaerales bacterium]|nr:hypothetical protein [Phycisphaerales bacterium]
MFERLRIVLVRPMGPMNVGAIARAMANFGAGRLVLVQPACDWLGDEARTFAVHARAILEQARVTETVSEALAGCVKTYATTAKLGLYRRQSVLGPGEMAADLWRCAIEGDVALVFGPEDRGLLTTELLQFDRVVSISTADAYPVLNIAAAATLLLYELFRNHPAEAARGETPYALNRDLATDERKQRMFAKLFDALERVGFLFGQNPEHLRYALRHLLGRADLTVVETDILFGLAAQIRWYVENHPPTGKGHVPQNPPASSRSSK